MALSKNCIKYIRSLELKKDRKTDKVFLAEGPKLVGDLLGHSRCRFLIATVGWLPIRRQLPVKNIAEVSEKELLCVSLLRTPQQMLAVSEQLDEVMDTSVVAHSLCLAPDDVQDPGDLGATIRLADWPGIGHIFCSPNTVDTHNPKTVQATMGDIVRVKLRYTSLPGLIGSLEDVPVHGTFLGEESMYTQPLPAHGLIVMRGRGNDIGNEVK